MIIYNIILIPYKETIHFKEDQFLKRISVEVSGSDIRHFLFCLSKQRLYI